MNLTIDKRNWKKIRLADVIEWYQKDIPNNEQVKHGVQFYVTANHIDGDSIKFDRYSNIDDGQKGPTITKHFKKGDLLLSTRSVALRKAAIAPIDGVTGEKLLVLRIKHNSELISQLFPFVFQSIDFWEFAQNSASGSVNKFTSWTKIREYEFLLPPKDQQAQLAELLWAMDEVIEREREVLERVKITFQTYSKRFFKEDANSLIPLSECAEVIMGQSPAGDSYNQNENGTPLINGPTEFTDRFPIKIQWTTKPTKFCQDRDILLCVRGSTTGRMNISNDTYCIGRGVAAIRGKGLFKTDFLEFALRFNVDEIMRLASGSTFPNIDSKTLKSIVLPKVDHQHQELIISKLKALDENNMRTESKIISSQALQKSLINQIF